MWNPGLSFCKGCCPKPPCPACIAGGVRYSCLSVAVAGITGTTGSGSCSMGCDELFNGTYHLFEAGENWNPDGESGPLCRWASATPSCGVGCEGRVRAELYLATSGSDNLVIVRIAGRPHSSGTTEVIQFTRNVGSSLPNCYFDALEVPYDAANSTAVNCDFSGATCVVSADQSYKCTRLHQSSSVQFPWLACHRPEIPWTGYRVELDGFGNDACNHCEGINGTYIFSGPPQRIVGPEQAVYGWEIQLPETYGCDALNQMKVERITLAISNAAQNSSEMQGPRVYLTRNAGFPSNAYFAATCNCQDAQDLTAVPAPFTSAVFRGCQDGTVHIEPIE